MATFPGGQASVPVFNRENLPITRAEVMALIEDAGGGTTIIEGAGGANVGGTGSPEGVVDAAKYTQYFDESESRIYVKTTDSGILTGWV